VTPTPGRRRRLGFDQQVLASALGAVLPATLIALALVWTGDYSTKLRWTVTLLLTLFGLGFAFAHRRRVVFPIYTLANLIEALREGDYSLRGRRRERDDALSEVVAEVNNLADTLQAERLGEREATALLARVMEEIDVAVFTFDDRQALALVNRAGERLLDRPAEGLLGRTAAELGLGECLEGEPAQTLEIAFPGGEGRWGTRRRSFRQEGRRHQLLVITDLSRTLREEERQAWKRLIRVLGHELNNSLAPIKSMAATLATLLARQPRPEDLDDDLRDGLDVIIGRAESLSRFMAAYSRLARLPPPTLQPTPLPPLVERVAALESRVPVSVAGGPPLTIAADADHIDQLLINMLRNAADAALETGGGVTVGWRRRPGQLEVWVRDQGPGLSNRDNVFVPFYTTKPGGTGIGLVLCRQIAEAHGGSVTLENRREGGCEARLRLPLRRAG
jgi:nitrogen fixation/metabolism regulation signal transduction histidine kinase